MMELDQQRVINYYRQITEPYRYKYDPAYWAFRDWLVTHRTTLKSVSEVMRSLRCGVKVWRYKTESKR